MRGYKITVLTVLSLSLCLGLVRAQQNELDAAKKAYSVGDYRKTIEILKSAEGKYPNNGQIQLLLTKAYLESNHFDDAVKSGEKAVAIDPRSSTYHQMLGEAYGEKADHVGMLSAYSWARKAQKEFATAVQLDDHNFDADQDLIEYDCRAPSIAGGGKDKAEVLIQKLMAMDPAEGHYAQGVCNGAEAAAEYVRALENKPKTADRIYEMADYFLDHGNGPQLLQAAAAGEALAPGDPRGFYYQAVGLILSNQQLPQAEKLLGQYQAAGPYRSSYATPADIHYWLGRANAARHNNAAARNEYNEALKLDPKFKKAREALKQLDGQ
jgi:tetratricopeptide (TPR) repeat protein